MRVTRVRLRDFRTYRSAEVRLGPRLTIVSGGNGEGKTNLVEALYVGCTGHSCRTANERELVRFGQTVARVEVLAEGPSGQHRLSVGLAPGDGRRVVVDGVAVERAGDEHPRPLVGVFLPERLELVKGPPSLRRAHMDHLVAALWPTRAATRRAYGQALAQRNALLARGPGPALRASLPAWDEALARHGFALMQDRARAVEAATELFARHAIGLGLDGDAAVAYRPRSSAASPPELAAELAERAAQDVERRFTTHGPHRDELALVRAGRELRVYGSQGQQRLALLALLLAERDAIAALRGAPPLMLLDDVMSELDHERRARLVALLAEEGQSVITTTELDHVPGARFDGVVRLVVSDGAVQEEPAGAAAQDSVPGPDGSGDGARELVGR